MYGHDVTLPDWYRAAPWTGYTATDADVITFLTAASITDNRIQYGLDWWVLRQKSLGTWTRMVGIYPFVGGSSTPHAINMRTPGTFNLTFNGTISHSANGVDPDGTTGYSQTGIIPTVNLASDAALACYCRENTSVSTADYEMGCSTSGFGLAMATRRSNGGRVGIFGGYFGNSLTGLTGQTDGVGTGCNLITRISGTDAAWFNSWGRSNYSAGSTTGGTKPNNEILLHCLNNNGTPQSFSNKQMAFALISGGFTLSEANQVAISIARLQFLLGRHI